MRILERLYRVCKETFIGSITFFLDVDADTFLQLLRIITSIRFDSISFFHGAITFMGLLATGTVCMAFHANNRLVSARNLIVFSTVFLLIVFTFPVFYKQLQAGLSHMKGSAHLNLASEFGYLEWERLTAGYLKSFWPFFPIGLVALIYEALKKKTS